MSAERFLDLYRQIEELLERRYAKESRTTSNVIVQFIQEKQGSRYREELNLCREIRNVLSHHSTFQGQPVVEPADGVMQVMEQLVEELKKPPLALDYGTPADHLLWATPDERVLPLMETMREKGYSHIPVREANPKTSSQTVSGIFSTGSVFQYTLCHPERPITEETRLGDFREFLPIERHAEAFLFAKPDMNYWEAREAFSTVRKHRRLAAILITSDGTAGGRLKGMLTPWDVLGLEEAVTDPTA
jgi:CBS domain-containing protein